MLSDTKSWSLERGPRVEAVQHHHSEMPTQVPGQHLWIIASVFRVDPVRMADRRFHLDTENLLTIEGPGCYWCEKTWAPGLENTQCVGEPLGER